MAFNLHIDVESARNLVASEHTNKAIPIQEESVYETVSFFTFDRSLWLRIWHALLCSAELLMALTG